eukprot:5097927-Pyramimonas_sp.AAC.1
MAVKFRRHMDHAFRGLARKVMGLAGVGALSHFLSTVEGRAAKAATTQRSIRASRLAEAKGHQLARPDQ